nr:serine/threonine protein kinase [Streptomyces sp. DSM 41633]
TKSPAGPTGSGAASGASVPGQRPPASPASTRASITDVVPRRTLAIIAGVIVLAILGTVLAFSLGGDGDMANAGKGKGDTASAGASAGGSEGEGDSEGGASGGQKEGQGTGEGKAPEGDPSDGPADDPKTDDPEGDPEGD